MEELIFRIRKYKDERSWTDYQFAENADIPQSTISSWYTKGARPTLPTLTKVCKAFGITLTQLLAEEGEPVTLTPSQKALLERWSRLDEGQQAAVFQIIDKM